MKKLSPLEQKAKMKVMKDLRDTAASHMGDRLADLKKVTVASDSSEGLKHGLDKAKEIVGSPEMGHMLDQAEHPAGHEDLLSGDENEHEHDGSEVEDRLAEADEVQPESDEEEHAEHDYPMPSGDEDHEDMDEDEIDRKLQHLMSLKEKKKAKKY